MGVALPVLAIGQALLGVVTGIAQIGMARQQAAAATEAAATQLQDQYKEIDRQQSEVNRIAQEQTSDRMRAANMELGTMRVSALERGVSGSTISAFARTIGYLEGVDISRIETNRKGNIEAGQNQKEAARHGYISTVTLAQNQAKAATVSAVLGMAGSGLSIGADYYKGQQQMKYMQNQRAA